MEGKMKDITRRDLLIFGGVGTAGLAMGMTGCSQPRPKEEPQESSIEEQKTWDPKKTVECDVVVVGAGSGLWAAYVTASAGLNTHVVEKSSSCLSSNTNYMRGTTAAETSVQKDLGDPCTYQTVIDAMMDFARGTVNAQLVNKCLHGSTKALDTWRELGCNINLATTDLYGVGFNSVHTYKTENKLGLVEDALNKMGCQFDYNTEGKELIVEEGAVTGLYAEGPEGVVEYKAKAVVLACGGFLEDDDLMKRCFGEHIQPGRFRYAMNDGAGIKMAMKAGAILDTNFAMSSLANNAGFNEKCEGIVGSYMDSTKRSQAFSFDVWGTLHVDKNGDRFINEYRMSQWPLTVAGAIEMRIGYYYAIADQKMIDYLQEHSAFDRVGRPDYWVPGPILLDKPNERLQSDINAAIEQGWAWKADTPEALAEAAGLPHLATQIKKYNESCAAGFDDELYLPKEFLIALDEGPYYAIQYQCGALNTMGGIRTDNFCRAVDKTDTAIEGLYIGSADNGSAFAAPYYNVGGCCNAMCMGSSWVAGETIVDDVAE